MIKRSLTSYISEIKPVEFCGKYIGTNIKFSSTYEPPFETKPTKGKHDFNNCEGCQNQLVELESRLKKRYEGNHRKEAKPFPYCCEYHSQLINLREFKKSDFDNVPKMVAHKIIYTYQHILNNYQNEDYYEDITDYIEYTVESFGQMAGKASPLYLDQYFLYVSYRLDQMEIMPKHKKNTMLEYLSTCQAPAPKKKTDLNILINTYQKWYKIFPFDIPFLKHLESHFKKSFPILNGMPKINRYTGIASAKLHTKESLIEALIRLTDELLTTFNTFSLHKQELLTEPDQIKLELILSERRSKLKQGYVSHSQDEETQYRKILKEWFVDEKRFIDEIKPILKKLPAQSIEKQKPPLTEKLITFDSLETIKKLHDELKGYFPNKEAELQRALKGEHLTEFLLFPHNQNKFVEVFRRLKYNGFLLSSPKEIKDWICANFNYRYKRGVKEEVRKFNISTVHDYLTKDKGDLNKDKRICNVDWLQYKSHLQLSREVEKDKI